MTHLKLFRNMSQRQNGGNIYYANVLVCLGKKKRFLKSCFSQTLDQFCSTYTRINQGRERPVKPQAKDYSLVVLLMPADRHTHTNVTAGVRLRTQEAIYPDCKLQLLSACLTWRAGVSLFHPSVSNMLLPSSYLLR